MKLSKHIENIVIGTPICTPEEIFGVINNPEVWEKEKELTIWTNERSLARLFGGEFEASWYEYGELKTDVISLGFAKSVSEVRRNRQDLAIMLDHLDYIEPKFGKNKLFILVGN